MKSFHKAAIVGTGLIGGSIAMAIKKQGLADKVVGVSRHQESLRIARQKGAIDQGAQGISIVKGADLLILALPVGLIIKLAPRLAKLVAPGCVVTDVGSTKAEITAALSKIFPFYVGSHPLAGSEKRGIAYADAKIFKNSLCILTPTINTRSEVTRRVSALWKKFGARITLLSPVTHDKILSFTSHLPHAVAFSLIGAVPPEHLKFASSGLKDTTRLAASESGLWVDIFLSNRKDILKAIGAFERNLHGLKTAINKKDRKWLARFLDNAKEKRGRLSVYAEGDTFL
ncbi:MAG: prephenate dehydrogenase, partial [Candidatus Omnitrophica bacterium]|nr:prephenate dehydrogenase [Candidatus Omnitrophota bacterium]